jgi:3-oxoacyl-(acyl-carrier-protein) synthase
MGVVSPLGNTIDAFWDGLVSGRSAGKSLKDILHCDLFKRLFEHHSKEFFSQVITEVEAFDSHTLPASVRHRDRYAQFAVYAALQAVYAAQLLDASPEMREDWGIAFTTAVGAAQVTEAVYCQSTNDGAEAVDPRKVPEEFYLDFMCNTPALLLGDLLDIHGRCDTISSACASGIDMIGLAYEAIRDGEAQIMLAVSSEAPLAPTRFGGCDAIHCLSTHYNDQPQRASRPFDKSRDGFVMGEGAGAFILEEREHALRRGAPILAEITGFGLTSNATHMVSLKPATAPHLARAITQAIHAAGITPEEIDYVNTHGSSTNQNDETETRAIHLALGSHADKVVCSSTKSEIGHPLATAGFFGVMAAVLTFQNNMVHPTINYEEPDPLCDLDYVPNNARAFTGTNALILSSGFSGTHATLVIKRAGGDE